jgi:hypothetical protein
MRSTLFSPVSPFQNLADVRPAPRILPHSLAEGVFDPRCRVGLFGVSQLVGQDRREQPDILFV